MLGNSSQMVTLSCTHTTSGSWCLEKAKQWQIILGAASTTHSAVIRMQRVRIPMRRPHGPGAQRDGRAHGSRRPER